MDILIRTVPFFHIVFILSPPLHVLQQQNYLFLQLCADGYDVTNLLSADPTLRRRGFKLEYFLRPPVQVRWR